MAITLSTNSYEGYRMARVDWRQRNAPVTEGQQATARRDMVLPLLPMMKSESGKR